MPSGRYPAQYLRREWDGLSPSPYYPALKGFADNLADILSYYKVAKTDSEIDSILGFDPKHSLNEMVSVLSGYTLKGTKLKSFSFQIDEKTLDRWFVRLEEEISLDSKFKLRDKRLIMRDLKDLFDATYKKFGYEAYHPLYRSVRLMLARVGEVLVDAGAIEKNTFSNLEELTGLNLINLYNYLLTNPRCNPDIDPTLALKGKAIEKAIEKTKKGNAEFTSEHEKQIEEIIGNHIVQLLDFRKGRKLLESYRPSYRLDLLRNIVDRCSILQKVRYKYELANLLLGDFDFSTNFLKPHKDMDQSKPHLEEVFQIIINSFRWSKKTFSDLGISVTDSELRIFKFIINKEVKKWVFNVENLETSWVRYISKLKPERVIGAPTSMKMDYDLVFALFQASLIHEDNPKLTFSDMAANKFFDRSKNLIANLRRGIGFSPEAVRKMLITTIAWIKTEAAKDPNSYKLKYYFSLQAHIQFYAMKHHMSLMKPKGGGSTRFFNGRRFGYDYIVAYHVVEGIGKHLGIDPLFFSAIKDESFHMTKTLRNKLKDLGEKVLVFIRHHFRDDPVGRDSFLAKDNLITDASKHVSWESLDERDSLIVLEGYEKLIRMKGTGQRMPGTSGINEITRKDIEQVFRGEEWVYARWYSDRDFTSNLKEFNNKRRDIRSMTLDKFIKTYNPIAYARFYENILKDKRPQLQLFLSELHPTLDISSVIAAGTDSIYLKEITRAFSWLLRQDNYPIKI